MTNDRQKSENFGCINCWPSDAELAWDKNKQLPNSIDLIDESHLHVLIRNCQKCQQHFLAVFTEMVDWADGEDPQHWLIVPLKEEEAESLLPKGQPLTEVKLQAFTLQRRCLHRDYPKGAEPSIYWGDHFYIGPHD